MRFDSENPILKLKARQIVRVPDMHGARIACRNGSVWITQDGDNTDFVLERGESFASDKTGQILIYGLGDAEVEIVEAANAPIFASQPPPQLALAA